jgi:transmembrane sensor
MSDPTPEVSASSARQLEVRWNGQRLEHNLGRVHARARRRRAWSKSAGGLVALALTAALFALFWPKGASAPAGFHAAALPSAKSPKTTFIDGSVARVSEGGELVVNLATPERIEAVLSTGAADFEVTKHPERDFVVLAGSVRVRVVGTRFRIELHGERTRIAVSEGKVEVHESTGSTALIAGESRFFPTPPAVEAAPVPTPPASSPRARFLELARGGQYKAAYRVLSQSPSVVGSSAEELLLAADAARLSSHPEQAVGYLKRVTSEHPADSRAPLSAFTLGRVLLSQLGRPAEAAEAFALARRLRPNGSLAEDALAREAEARDASGSSAAAKKLASDYVGRYPRGKHAATMQRLVTGK